jgi:hypothetical protein
MATPPPSLILNNYTITALQTAADYSPLRYQPSTAAAVAMLNFENTNKRQSEPPRSGISSGPNSSVKKRLNTRVLPQRRVTINNGVPRAMNIDSSGYDRSLTISSQLDEACQIPRKLNNQFMHLSLLALSSNGVVALKSGLAVVSNLGVDIHSNPSQGLIQYNIQ